MWKVKTEKGLHFSTILFFESFFESIVKLWMNKLHMRWSTEQRWLFSFSSLIAFGFGRLLQARKKERQKGEIGRSPVEIVNNTILQFYNFHASIHVEVNFNWTILSLYLCSFAHSIAYREKEKTTRNEYNTMLYFLPKQHRIAHKARGLRFVL